MYRFCLLFLFSSFLFFPLILFVLLYFMQEMSLLLRCLDISLMHCIIYVFRYFYLHALPSLQYSPRISTVSNGSHFIPLIIYHPLLSLFPSLFLFLPLFQSSLLMQIYINNDKRPLIDTEKRNYLQVRNKEKRKESKATIKS